MGSESVDGRRARRSRNRDAVVDAVIDELLAGEAFPSVRRIADRSGVSLRSVHRYFDDGDEVVLAALDAFAARHRAALRFPEQAPTTPLDERVARWVDFRIRDSLTSSPGFVALTARARRSERIAERVESFRHENVAAMAALFAPELDALPADHRAARLAAAHTVTLVEAWYNLHVRHGLTPDEVRPAWERALHIALTGPVLP